MTQTLRVLARDLGLRVRIYRRSGLWIAVDRSRYGARVQLGRTVDDAARRLRMMAMMGE